MEAHRVERKLSAIFAADVEGYSRLMGRDEVDTLRTLTAYRVFIDRLIASHRGRIFNTAGDSVLADFGSAVDAVECAVEIQDAIAKEIADRPAGEQMRFRFGVHVGDIIVQGDNLFGDAVNVAAVDVKQVGRELGVRYVLEGSVRKSGQRVRITAQLIDALTGTHLWADRFDGSLEDIFELQDKVAISVAGVIEPTLQAAEIRRSVDRPTNDLTAYDLYLRALANFPWSHREQIVKALDLFEQAVACDPGFAPALAWAAVCRQNRVVANVAQSAPPDRCRSAWWGAEAPNSSTSQES